MGNLSSCIKKSKEEKPPEGEEEEQNCKTAMENCPVEAIGDFGNK